MNRGSRVGSWCGPRLLLLIRYDSSRRMLCLTVNDLVEITIHQVLVSPSEQFCYGCPTKQYFIITWKHQNDRLCEFCYQEVCIFLSLCELKCVLVFWVGRSSCRHLCRWHGGMRGSYEFHWSPWPIGSHLNLINRHTPKMEFNIIKYSRDLVRFIAYWTDARMYVCRSIINISRSYLWTDELKFAFYLEQNSTLGRLADHFASSLLWWRRPWHTQARAAYM